VRAAGEGRRIHRAPALRAAEPALTAPERRRTSARVRAISLVLFDLVVFGASAIDPEHGVMGPTSAHAALAEVLRRRGRRCMALADATKFGRTDRYILTGFDDLDVVVSDRLPPPPFPELLGAADVQVVTARPLRPDPALREGRGGG
jgi:hypothetical protein